MWSSLTYCGERRPCVPERLLTNPVTAALLVFLGSSSCVMAQDPVEADENTQSQGVMILPSVTISGTRTPDTTTTEGTGLYTTGQTTAATRLPLTLRETPQSISVVTRQRMDDQKLDSVQGVLESTTGISPYQSDSQRTSFYSRGFLIDNIQYDGIPAVIGDVINGSGISDLETAFYDRVEIVRGANGLLTGTGNPSAAVNLVRKRPTPEFSASTSISAGSWDSFREMGDVSVPLTTDGRIRARMVGVNNDGHSYIDGYQTQKQAFYGVIEADLTEDTTLDIGYDYQNSSPERPTWGGVPLWFSNGSEAEWSRSKSLAADWNRWDSTRQTAFAELEHRFDNGWKVRGVVNQYRTKYDSQLLGGFGTPDQDTGLGVFPNGAYPVALAGKGKSRQNTFDVMASGPFDLMGRQHDLVVGAMSSRYTSNKDDISPFFVGFTPGNIYNWNNHFPKPDFDAMASMPTDTEVKQRGFYSTARFSLADPLKLIVGGRFSRYEIDETAGGTPFNYKKSNEFTPYAGLIYDIDSTYSVYISYTGIFNPQTSFRDSNGNVLTPTEGKTKEIGLKAEYLEGRLNASVALFDTELDNAAQPDGSLLTPGGAQAYKGVDGTKSRGVEFDLQGEVAPNWNIYAGIAAFTAKDGNDARLNAQVPRTTAQMFTTYKLPGMLEKLTLGAGVRWQSRFLSSSTSTRVAEQDPYALTSLMARYELSRNMDLSINVNNVFDKKYATQKGDFDTVSYGAPRNALMTLNYKL
ncbi:MULTISPECIES: TonB-dependent siderophore receptor [Pseudomonas]|uniref:TonB-dependent siderophore receptor n=1 Tax=Pseudomonas TaxID=286 RepID=UPI000A73FBD3|nr:MULTISPECIES: TonB-dependent siderophore receptor [Pseudomonas]